jgi:hypothetical protein
MDGARCQLTVGGFFLRPHTWGATVLSLLVVIPHVFALARATCGRTTAPVTPLRPDAVNRAVMHVTVCNLLQATWTTQTTELRLRYDLTSDFLATTSTAHGAFRFHPIANFAVDWARNDEAIHKLLSFWAFTTSMSGFNKDGSCHLLLSCITRSGAIALVAPFTYLAINWAWPNNTALFFNESTFAIKTSPLCEDLATTAALLDSGSTESIASSPWSPLIELTIDRTRNDLARLGDLSFLGAFHTSMCWFYQD